MNNGSFRAMKITMHTPHRNKTSMIQTMMMMSKCKKEKTTKVLQAPMMKLNRKRSKRQRRRNRAKMRRMMILTSGASPTGISTSSCRRWILRTATKIMMTLLIMKIT